MRVKSRHITANIYEVEGVIIYAKSMAHAIHKWSRTPQKDTQCKQNT